MTVNAPQKRTATPTEIKTIMPVVLSFPGADPPPVELEVFITEEFPEKSEETGSVSVTVPPKEVSV